MLDNTILKRFLTNTDDTGRFLASSKRTGKKYFVEPIIKSHTPEWGSIDPATGKLMHKKGDGKYRGGINASETIITNENGFKNITTLYRGLSPLAYIDMLDDKYPSI